MLLLLSMGWRSPSSEGDGVKLPPSPVAKIDGFSQRFAGGGSRASTSDVDSIGPGDDWTEALMAEEVPDVDARELPPLAEAEEETAAAAGAGASPCWPKPVGVGPTTGVETGVGAFGSKSINSAR